MRLKSHVLRPATSIQNFGESYNGDNVFTCEKAPDNLLKSPYYVMLMHPGGGELGAAVFVGVAILGKLDRHCCNVIGPNPTPLGPISLHTKPIPLRRGGH